MYTKKNFGEDRAEMHEATCASCGKECEVPFKPNGRKPVLCHNCFRKNDGEVPERSERFERPRPPARERGGDDQLEIIIEKLDAILRALKPAPRSEERWTPRPPMHSKRQFGKGPGGFKKHSKF